MDKIPHRPRIRVGFDTHHGTIVWFISSKTQVDGMLVLGSDGVRERTDCIVDTLWMMMLVVGCVNDVHRFEKVESFIVVIIIFFFVGRLI